MRSKSTAVFVGILLALAFGSGAPAAIGQTAQRLAGTLVVAVPVADGVVVCSDKRMYNLDAGTYTDDFVKIRKVSDSALFAATNTVGFYDAKQRKIAFDAFEVTSRYTARNTFSDSPQFWNGLKKEIIDQIRAYLAKRSFAEWPESDRANNDLLFNLVFYSINGDRIFSHTLRVYYKKAAAPVVHAANPIREEVRTPKLSGKGSELVRYLARNPEAASDPAILAFDPSRFDAERTTADKAVNFAGKLFRITSSALPHTHVSPTFDCASLSSEAGFKWLKQDRSTIFRSHPLRVAN